MSELEAVFYVPLVNSQLCANCEAISSMGRGSHCICCGSSALQSLSAILNRGAAVEAVIESGVEWFEQSDEGWDKNHHYSAIQRLLEN